MVAGTAEIAAGLCLLSPRGGILGAVLLAIDSWGAVIGGDGFGFAVGDGEIVKIPQVGIVVIEDDVEIGRPQPLIAPRWASLVLVAVVNLIAECRLGTMSKLVKTVCFRHLLVLPVRQN